MSTTSLFQQYSDAAELIPDEAKLGQLVVFQIAGADIPLTEVRADLAALGLPLDSVPTRIRPIDAFPKAARIFERKRIPVKPGVVTNFWKRDVNDKGLAGQVAAVDSNANYQYIVRERVETVAGKRRSLIYDPVVELIYTKGEWKDGQMVGDDLRIVRRNPIEPLTGEEKDWIDAKVAAMPAEFEHRRTHLDSHAVRGILRGFLWDLQSVGVQGPAADDSPGKSMGGFYFVPQNHADTVEKLAEWVRSIGCTMMKFTLLNLADEREMIRDALEEDSITKLNQAMNKVGKILGDPDRTITEDTWKGWVDYSSDLIAKITGYSDMLNLKVDRAANQAMLFKLQTLELGKRVQTKKAS